MYEIEIKSLLGSSENAQHFKKKMMDLVPEARMKGKNKQRNHYFVGGDYEKMVDGVSPHLSKAQQGKLYAIIRKGKGHSVRTRELGEKTLLVVKASVDDTTSSNGISRMEFEEEVGRLTLDQLDKILLDAGLAYQAKWSREREEFALGDITVCLDRNAGYGFVAEFEKIIKDEKGAEKAKGQLRTVMKKLGVEELPQDRLERMFAYYNEHWPEYYGTEKIFTVE